MTRNEDQNRPSRHPKPDDQTGFFRKETKSLRAAARRGGLGREDSEAVTQEALIADLLRRLNIGPFADENEERHWLRAVEKNKIADVKRRRAKRKAQSVEDLPEEPEDGEAEREKRTRTAREWVEELMEMLRRIDPEGHRLVCAHYLEQRSFRELANEAGCTVDAIRGRIRRALKKLKEEIRPDDEAKP